MISSTARDLPQHREQVMDACLRQGMFPLMMEHLPASDADAIEVSLKMVEEADIYLGIYAHRYGYVPEGHDISITEMEYNRAVELGKPRLLFVMHDDHPVRDEDVDRGDKALKLATFRERILRERVVNFFRLPADLRALAIAALSKYRSPPKIPWPKLREVCATLSAGTIKSFDKKLGSGVYVHRKTLQDHVDRFLEDMEKNYLALVGKSGMGKSAFLWGLANRLREKPNIAFLFCEAKSYLVEGKSSIIEVLLEALSKTMDVPPGGVLRAIERSEEQSACRLVFIVDAVNEFSNMKDMGNIFSDFESYAVQYPWIRLILSCRPHFWHYVQNEVGSRAIREQRFYRVGDDRDLYVRVENPDDEEMEALYRSYRSEYGFEPAEFKDLDKAVQKRLREPLMLWLVSEVCKGESISDKRDLVLVDVTAIPAYTRVLQRDGHLHPKDPDYLEKCFPRFFVQRGQCTNYVYRKDVIDPNRRVTDKQRLGRLIDSVILQEDQDEGLSFSFERFYGYFVGRHLHKLVHDGEVVDCDTERDRPSGG
jgi:hypothetical protein